MNSLQPFHLAFPVKDLSETKKLEQVRQKGEEIINTKYDWNEIGKQTKQAYQSLY